MLIHPGFRPAFRRAAAGSALVVAVVGLPALTAPSASADVALGTCAVTAAGTTMTLTADCETFDPLVVPDGWTVDGAGHTITAVQDADHPSYLGGVLESAVGDDTAAATMNVKNLAINSRGFDQFTQDAGSNTLYGIKMVRAGGTITDVSITGIAHNIGQTSRAFFVSNEAGGSLAVPIAGVTLDGVSISRYQKSGLYLSGNLAFDVRNLDVRSASNMTGSQNVTNAANGVTVINGASGTITDSTLGHNRYATDDSGTAQDAVAATSVLLYNAGPTTMARNVIQGTDGDVGVEVYNDSTSITTLASMTCSTLVRTSGDNADPNLGFGVWNVEDNSPGSVELTLAGNTYRGWSSNVRGESASGTAPECTTSNQLTSSTQQVGFRSPSTLIGTIRNQDGSAATGTATLQRRENGTSTWIAAGTATTASNGRYSFRVTPDQLTAYRTVFSGDTYTGSTSNAVSVRVAPKVTIRPGRYNVKRHRLATFTGVVGPDLPRYRATLQQRFQGHWVNVDNMTLSAGSVYQLSSEATHRKGKRYFRVVTTGTRNHAAGISRVVTIRVVR